MLIDTDVLIWYMRGNENAYQAIENTDTFFISVITYMELIQGLRNKKELALLRKALHDWKRKSCIFLRRYPPRPCSRSNSISSATPCSCPTP